MISKGEIVRAAGFTEKIRTLLPCLGEAACSPCDAREDLWKHLRVPSEALGTVDTESGTELGGEISAGGGAYWSSQYSKTRRVQGVTFQGRK